VNFKETGWQDVERVYVGQVRDNWQAVVETVMNLRVQ
jgi:hypothetical protein